MTATDTLFRVTESKDPGTATLQIRCQAPGAHKISPYITGKFTEHLWHNVYHGIDAQILQNPTFGDHPFGGGNHPDGGNKPESDEEKVADQIRARAARTDWPDPERLVESRQDGLAHWWIREGARDDVLVSPDLAAHGQRAQRVEVKAAGQGVAQWTHLPLHRVRTFAWQVTVRSPDISVMTLALTPQGQDEPAARAEITGLSRAWQTFAGTLEVPDSIEADALVRCALTACSAGQFVVAGIRLHPTDHVNHADPDVIRFFKNARLPLMRWPGGNFVSGYHWEDGIGPLDERPTRHNPAWANLEPNSFGTDEFLALCREVGCEPMICINTGDGTPAEAARWIEYCNGPADSPMGRKRAANGHSEPYNVHLWEIGNEIYGKWQVTWTTPQGYADRYRQYVEAMRAVDPSIRVLACGVTELGPEPHPWNEALIEQDADILETLTIHVLCGAKLPQSSDPMQVFIDRMAVPLLTETHSAALAERMRAAGIADPHVAITELQLFDRLDTEGEPGPLSPQTMLTPTTLAEAPYDILFYHAAVRQAPVMDMITHSATVNHGGGLRKTRERVFANPCHYAQSLFAAFAQAVPVAVELACPTLRTTGTLSYVPKDMTLPVIDALAALAPGGALLISLVHRGTDTPIKLRIAVADKTVPDTAEVMTLTGDKPWAQNTLQEPEAITPQESRVAVADGTLEVMVPPCSVVRVRLEC